MFGFGFEDLIRFMLDSWASGSVKSRRPAPKTPKPNGPQSDRALKDVARTMRLKPPEFRAESEHPDAWPTDAGTPYDRDRERWRDSGWRGD